MSARGGASAGCRVNAATRPGIRSITSVQFSGSAAISRGTRTGGRCRTNARYAAISCWNRSVQAGEWSSKHFATAVARPVVPTIRTERPLRRSTWTGLNSGQMRCTEAMAIRTCAPCGPERSMRPLRGPAPGPAARRVRPRPCAGAPAWGARYGPPPVPMGRSGRGGADTEDDAVYMGETDPFVRRQVTCANPADGRSAPWGVPRAAGRGGAFLPDTGSRVADHLADPGEPWRIVTAHLTGG
ncbi:protein of unknown function [Streptomyces sp. KY75]|nr:protein of unknown function [Streptomyces sp. KY75]CAD5993699.1 protein of unknown function [Streptomyces sp. KY70]